MTTIELGQATMPWSTRPIHVRAELRLVDDLNPPDVMKETTDHRQLRRGDVPSISVTWEYGTRAELNRGDGSGGAGIDAGVVDAIEPPELQAKARRIVELADRWHLNTMTPGCVHQAAEWHCTGRDGDHVSLPQGWGAIRERHGEHPYPQRGDQCDRCGRNRWNEPTDACPVTGYRWGTAWLMEVPPHEVIAELQLLFSETETEVPA